MNRSVEHWPISTVALECVTGTSSHKTSGMCTMLDLLLPLCSYGVRMVLYLITPILPLEKLKRNLFWV